MDLIKRQIRSALFHLGYEVHRRREQPAIPEIFQLRNSMMESLRHIKKMGFIPGAVIDVGVADGTPELYETFSSSRHLLVEPLAEHEPAMRRICSQYNAEYVLAAAGAENCVMSLGVSALPDASSLLTASTEPVAREVAVVRIDDLCAERRLAPPYLIKIDVQGAELMVLDGARKALLETEVVILEVSLFSFIGNPVLADVIIYMRDLNFVAYDL